jgi:hypothetical protein
MNTIRREFTFETKILDEKKGIVRYIASDETLDCYNEIVRAKGWRFTHFKRNAPFIDSHNYGSIRTLLGQVVAFRVEGTQLIEEVQYALTEAGDTLADWAFKMVRGGFLRACSVGFCPVRMASKWDSDKTAFLGQIADLGLDAQAAAKLNAVYIEQEQIELSQCVIGANPNALTLARAYKAGCLSEGDLEKISATIAQSRASENASEAHGPASASDATKRAARIAFMAEVQRHL